MKKYRAVIMAGGAGTRLWPMSRQATPKQFQKLVSDKSLLQETFIRVSKILPVGQILVATAQKYKKIVLDHLPELSEEQVLVEPVQRNTSPAFGLIALQLMLQDPEVIVATVASDHLIANTEEFVATFKAAFRAVEKFPRKLVAVGIKPDNPNTGLGYIKIGSEIGQVDGKKVFSIDTFTEKPDEKTARQYIKSWQYLWNAAYYFWHGKDQIRWLSKTRPKMVAALKEIVKLSKGAGNEEKIRRLYEKLENEQIEHSVVEKLKDTIVIPADLGWSDIGNWGTLQEVLSSQQGTPVVAHGHRIDHVDHESQDILVYTRNKMVATIGLKDIIIVDSDNVILVANKNRAQDIKILLDRLKSEGKHLYL